MNYFSNHERVQNRTQTRAASTIGSLVVCHSPEDGNVEVVAGGNVGSFDVVAEEDEGDEQIVDVGLVHGEEDQGSVVLQTQGQIQHCEPPCQHTGFN